MRTTFNTLFFLKKTALKKDGTMPIMARITVNRTVAHFSTKLSIHPENWDTRLNRAKTRDRDAKEINLLLSEIKSSITKSYYDVKRIEEIITAEQVKNDFLGISANHETLLTLFKKHNDDLNELVGITKSKATHQKYNITYKHLENYIKFKYNRTDIPLKAINHLFVMGFENYLLTKCNCNSNTVAKFQQFFKRIIIIARNNGMIVNDPFSNYKIRIQKVDRGYLTEDELKLILKKTFSCKRLEQVRDVFIFSCFTGLAYIDVKNLKKENIRKSFDGKLWIMTKRQKTNIQSNILLLDVPLQILKKYEGTFEDRKILPILSNQKMNAYLKEVADICGINKDISFHLARHTFATTVTLAKGVPIESVSKMLGHNNIKTTQIYARITNEKLSHDMSVLSRKLTALNKAVKL